MAAHRPEPVTGRFELVGYGLLVSLGLAVFVAPFASSWPDGLEAIAHSLGFEQKTQPALLPAPMTDYQVPWIGSATTATALAGLVGTVIAFVAAYVFARMLVPVLSAGKKDAPSTH